jgi:signal transduction histidine kinase
MNPETGSGSAAPAERIERMAKAAREIGHDLNNCLGIIGGRAELVLMYLEQGRADGARKGVEVVLSQVERMKELSESLRDLEHRT